MKKEYPFFMRCLDLATIIAFGLVIVVSVFEIDGSKWGINFANIAGGLFLVLLFICSGITLICPQYKSVVAKVIFGRWYRR